MKRAVREFGTHFAAAAVGGLALLLQVIVLIVN